MRDRPSWPDNWDRMGGGFYQQRRREGYSEIAPIIVVLAS